VPLTNLLRLIVNLGYGLPISARLVIRTGNKNGMGKDFVKH
jgi:hypothetical protein